MACASKWGSSQLAVAWRVHQDVIDAYADHDRRRGKKRLIRVIDRIRSGVPDGLDELVQLGRALHRRRADMLAYFSHRASNGPTEAINGRLEALRRDALGFRSLLHYRI
ncbi:transposase [Rhodococcus ruber]|uniref:transposase n=1 Tax=Rhodococcus ruber TaxID=1830 RepID=UPI003784DAE8